MDGPETKMQIPLPPAGGKGKKAILWVLLILAIVAVVLAVVWRQKKTAVAPPAKPVSSSTATAGQAAAPSSAFAAQNFPADAPPPNFPADFPIYSPLTMKSSFTATSPTGQPLAARVFVTAKSAADVYQYYKNYLSAHGWSVTNLPTPPVYAYSLNATGNNHSSVVIYMANSQDASGALVSIQYFY